MLTWKDPGDGTFPSLGYAVADWIESNCVIPDGDLAGQPMVLSDVQFEFIVHSYRLYPDAEAPEYEKDARGHWRRTRQVRAFMYGLGMQFIGPQKWGKSPFAGSIAIAEGYSEAVLFAGWRPRRDEDTVWPSAWEVVPVTRAWPTPWIEITASSQDQADNVWRSVLDQIRRGNLAGDIPDAGETRINIPGGGVIKPVTASPRSRLGGRVTFAVQDETHSLNRSNRGDKLADTQRRNLAGMGGRFFDTGNAWDPAEESVAQTTYGDGKAGAGVYRMMLDGGPGSIRRMRERVRVLKNLYGNNWWVNLREDGPVNLAIDALIKKGEVAQAERFFFNRVVPAEDRAVDPRDWRACEVGWREVGRDMACTAHPRENAYHDRGCGRALVTIGVDGARYIDAIAVVATEVGTGYHWPLGIWERPPDAGDDYEHPMDEVDAVVTEAFERFNVWRLYADPGSQTANISPLVEKWQGRWGDKRVIEWLMSRPRVTAMMVRRYAAAIKARDVQHPQHDVMDRHVANARRRQVPAKDEDGGNLWVATKDAPNSPRKMDGFAAGALSWEARGDAISAGVLQAGGSAYEQEDRLCWCAAREPRPHMRLTTCAWVPRPAAQ